MSRRFNLFFRRSGIISVFCFRVIRNLRFDMMEGWYNCIVWVFV